MIPLTDERLRNWVTSVVGDLVVSLSPPAERQTGEGVNLYLLSLVDTPPASGSHAAPLQFSVRYLVTTWAEDPTVAHQLLNDLAFAALADGEMDVIMGDTPADLWLALGVVPQPSFIIQEVVRMARPEEPVRLVRHPLVVETQPATTLVGLVRGPADFPIAGARVECPSLNLSTYSDSKGRFRFANVPAGMPARLVVRAKGRKQEVTVTEATSTEEPIVIEFVFD